MSLWLGESSRQGERREKETRHDAEGRESPKYRGNNSSSDTRARERSGNFASAQGEDMRKKKKMEE